MRLYLNDWPEEKKLFKFYKAQEYLDLIYFSDSVTLKNLDKINKYSEAKKKAEELLPLVSKCLDNGSVIIADDYEEATGVTGVACKIGSDVFYFANDPYEDLKDYLELRDYSQIVSDVTSGVLNLLYDDEGYNQDEGKYVVSFMQSALEESLSKRKGDYIKKDILDKLDKLVDKTVHHYKTDWTIHDRDRVLDSPSNARFICMLRDTGCDTAFLSGKYLSLDNLDWSGACLERQRSEKYIYYDGKKLQSIPYEKAKKLFDEVWKSLPKEYFEEYNRCAETNRPVPCFEEWCEEHKKFKKSLDFSAVR